MLKFYLRIPSATFIYICINNKTSEQGTKSWKIYRIVPPVTEKEKRVKGWKASRNKGVKNPLYRSITIYVV